MDRVKILIRQSLVAWIPSLAGMTYSYYRRSRESGNPFLSAGWKEAGNAKVY